MTEKKSLPDDLKGFWALPGIGEGNKSALGFSFGRQGDQDDAANKKMGESYLEKLGLKDDEGPYAGLKMPDNSFDACWISEAAVKIAAGMCADPSWADGNIAMGAWKMALLLFAAQPLEITRLLKKDRLDELPL